MNLTIKRQGFFYLLGSILFRIRKFKLHQKILKEGFYLQKAYFEGVYIYFYINFKKNPDLRKKNLILLHGFLDNSFTFRKILFFLKNDYNVFILDLPGHGNSKVPYIRELWQINALARYLYRFVFEYLQISQPIFLTHSMGGFLVFHMLRYAKKRKEYPKKFNCNLIAIAPGMLKFKRNLREKNQRMFFPKTIQDIDLLLENLFPQNLPEIPTFMKYYLLQEWNHTGIQYLTQNTLENEEEVFFTEKSLKNHPTPKKTILIWGTQDRIVPLQYGKKLEKIIPNSKLILIPNAGHTPHSEKPEIFLEYIKYELKKF